MSKALALDVSLDIFYRIQFVSEKAGFYYSSTQSLLKYIHFVLSLMKMAVLAAITHILHTKDLANFGSINARFI